MKNKTRGSEKTMFSCEKNGKRSLADFENVEEALQASGGYHFNPVFQPVLKIQPVWWRYGQPDPTIFQNFQNLTQRR